MSIFRIKKHISPYVILDKTCLEDDDLSWKAKGIHAYLVSKPDDWTVRLTQLMASSTDGRDSVRSALKELTDAGYITRRPIQAETGQFQGQEWIVYEAPIHRTTGNPQDGQPDTTKEGLILKKDKYILPNSQKCETSKPNSKPSPSKKVDHSAADLPEGLLSIEGFTMELWNDWMAARKKKRILNTKSAVGLLLKKLMEHPDEAVSAIETAVERGWAGFEWSWLESRKSNGFSKVRKTTKKDNLDANLGVTEKAKLL